MKQNERVQHGLFVFPFISMRYHYKKPFNYMAIYGNIYICNHPVYTRCTLFKIDEKGLAVIQQRFDKRTKRTWWEQIDPWLANDIYLNPRFREHFDMAAGCCKDGLYPTVTVRQLMWALKMKPLKKERWETTFDHKFV